MFRRWKERKAAAKNKKADGGVELIGVEARGSHYVGEQPEYLMKKKSRSMELLSETSRPPLPPDARTGKKERLRTVKSFSGETEGRERRRRSQDMPVFYTGNSTSGQASAIPNLRQGYGKQTPGYSPGGTPARQSAAPPQHHQPMSNHARNKHANGSPPISHPSAARTPSPGGRAARYRNIQIIPQMEPKQPASFPSTPTNGIRTPSPVAAPGQTSPRHKPKGTAIKIVEGWDEPEDTGSNVVQSHEVGVVPRSKIMEAFRRNQHHSSPFAITINDDSALGSASHAPVRLREGSEKRNKARPVSAVPFAMIIEEEDFQQKKQSLDRRNGHLTITFNE